VPVRVSVTPGTGPGLGFEQSRRVPEILSKGVGVGEAGGVAVAVGDGIGVPVGVPVGVGVDPGRQRSAAGE